MDVGLTHGVAGMSALQRRLDSITHNLANVSTPAYKGIDTAIRAELAGRGRRVELVTREVHDFSQGQLEHTGNPFDLGLLGEGFFALEGARGEVYTRDGSFRVDDKGVLQAGDGKPVVWETKPGTLFAVGQPVTIDRTGNVSQGGEQVGKLRVVAFDRPQKLSPVKDGTWVAPPDLRRLPSQAEVHQGSIERSNVNSVEQLIELIQVQRSFESAAALVSRIDETYRRLNGLR